MTIQSLQTIVDAAPNRAIITLADGNYDDPHRVVIDRDICFVGSRNAIINSELFVTGGAFMHLTGLSTEMNKAGDPARNGAPDFWPQNGHITVSTGAIMLDDCEMRNPQGFNKCAIQVFNGNMHFRAMTKFSRIDWRPSPSSVIELLYNSYGNVFNLTGSDNTPANINSGTTSAYSAAISVTSSSLILSGCNLTNFNNSNATPYGILVGRRGYAQIGAGVFTSVSGYPSGSMAVDGTGATYFVNPGSTI